MRSCVSLSSVRMILHSDIVYQLFIGIELILSIFLDSDGKFLPNFKDIIILSREQRPLTQNNF